LLPFLRGGSRFSSCEWYILIDSCADRPSYTSATVLIPARAYSYIRGSIPQAELLQAWQRAIEVLHRLSPLSSSAASCIAALQLLDKALVSDTSEATGQSSGMPKTPAVAAVPEGIRTAVIAADDPDNGVMDNMFAMLEAQDFSWLDALPLDKLSSNPADMPDLWQDVW
jgi:hypothetical protein